MNRAAFILKVKPGKEAEYKAAHQNVWPELIDAAHAAGFQNHSVFMQGRTLFLYIEAQNLERSLSDFLKDPVKVKWDEYMREFLDEAPEDSGEIEPGQLEEVFHFD